MSEQDQIPYGDEPFDASKSAQLRRLNSGARIGEGNLASYTDPSGRRLAWTGDEEAPFVKVLYRPPGIYAVSAIPQAAASGVLVASVVGSALHEAWITDSRDPNANPTPAQRWIQLFDLQAAPAGNAIPTYAPIAMCTGSTISISFVQAPLGFAQGIVIAISSTPNKYTAIAASQDWAITARIVNTGG